MADADTGWSSAARTDATGCMLQHSGDVRQSARVKLRVVPQRVRAIGHCLQRSKRCTSEGLTDPCALFSLWQLKAEAGIAAVRH